MKFPSFLLWVNGLLFALFGAGFLILPAQMAMLVTESAPASPGGLTDMRATYGGLSLGIGLFLGHCARTGAFRSGLLASLLMLSSAALGRLLGIYLDGKPTWMIVLLLTAEIIFSVLSVTALIVSDDENACGA
ncbi:MAG: DUF4345 family protein [Ferrovum myxofaciens]|uniref:DUF4345 family protein n=1 Tax=Ferrovum myxofaciens TaxID=416213 RepID=UPI0023543023|nr:DUF4345 family protein [Ferrovum myxofaciens]QKE41907.1 MAG: DUF4345 family protein [Ferrovum myxofaciens]